MGVKVLRILLLFISLIAGVIAVIVVVEPEIDLTAHSDLLSRHASTALGRTTTLSNGIQLTLGRHLEIRVKDLKVRNPRWAQEPDLMSSTNLMVRVDMLRFFAGLIYLEELRADQVVIATEKSEDGRRSWVVPHDSQSLDSRSLLLGQTRLLIERASVDSVIFNYRDSMRKDPLVVKVHELQQQTKRGIMTLSASGLVNQTAFQANGHFGTLEELLNGRDVRFDVEASLGANRITLAGFVGDLKDLQGIELQASLNVPNLEMLAQDLAIEYPIRGQANLAFRLDEGDSGLVVTTRGHLGANRVDISGSIERQLSLDTLTAQFDIEGPDLAAFGKAVAVEPLPAEPFHLTGSLRRRAPALEIDQLRLKTATSTLHIDARLPLFPVLSGTSGKARIRLEDAGLISDIFKTEPTIGGPLSLDGSIQSSPEGGTSFSIDAEWLANRLSTQGTLGEGPSVRKSSLTFLLSGPRLAELLSVAGIDPAINEPFELRGGIDVSADNTVLLDSVTGTIGKFQVEANGSLGEVHRFDDIDLAMQIRGDSLSEALSLYVESGIPDEPFQINTRAVGPLAAPLLRDTDATAGETRLALTGQIDPFPPHHRSDTEVSLEIPALIDWIPSYGSEQWANQAYRLTGRLKKSGSRWRLKDGSLQGGKSDWRLSASIDEQLRRSSILVSATTEGPDLRSYLPDIPGYEPAAAPFKLAVSLANAQKHVEINTLDVSWAGAALKGNGKMYMGTSETRAALDVQLNISDLSRLGTVDQFNLPHQPLRARAQLNLSDRETRVPWFNIETKNGTITGNFASTPNPKPRLELQARLDGVDIAPFMPQGPDTVDEATTRQNPAGSRTIPQWRFPFSSLREFDAQVDLQGNAIRLPIVHGATKPMSGNFDFKAALRDGLLRISKVHVGSEQVDIEAEGHIDASTTIPSIKIAMEMRESRLDFLASHVDPGSLPASNVTLELDARGNSLPDLPASMNGTLQASGGSGQTSNVALDEEELGEIGTAVLQAINPFRKEDPITEIECYALGASITDGLVELKPGLAIRTKKLDTIARGTIDLANEEVNLQFNRLPRRGIDLSVSGLVRPHVRITGSLADPNLSVDPSSAVVFGSTAAVTGGASVLVKKVLDRATAAPNPCVAIVEAVDDDGDLQNWNPLDSINEALENFR